MVDKVHSKRGISLPVITFKKLDNIYGQLGNLLHFSDLRVFYIEEKDALDKIEQTVLQPIII
jgi:hypothetical protein